MCASNVCKKIEEKSRMKRKRKQILRTLTKKTSLKVTKRKMISSCWNKEKHWSTVRYVDTTSKNSVH